MNNLIKIFILSAGINLGVNAYYVFGMVPPDGRWVFQLPLTSFFVMLYFILLYLVGKDGFENYKNIYILTYGVLQALVFIIFAHRIESAFQYVDQLYFRYVAIAPYLIIYGGGLALFALVMGFLKKVSAWESK